MIIYFEDGALYGCEYILNQDLHSKAEESNIRCNLEILHAELGVSKCLKQLRKLSKSKKNIILYTNSLVALSSDWCWNDELQAPELYIREKNSRKWTRIDKLTPKFIRRSHNLAKIYIAGGFNFTSKQIEKINKKILL